MTVLFLAGALGDSLARIAGWLLLVWLLVAVPVGAAIARHIAINKRDDDEEK